MHALAGTASPAPSPPASRSWNCLVEAWGTTPRRCERNQPVRWRTSGQHPLPFLEAVALLAQHLRADLHVDVPAENDAEAKNLAGPKLSGEVLPGAAAQT